MADVKMTKAMWFEEIKGIVAESDHEMAEEILAFIDTQLAALAAKAEKAKERAAKTKAEGDELRAAVESVLTDEFQYAEDILAQIDGEGLTKAKIVARLTQLIATGVCEKEVLKDEEGKRRTAYKLA